jgi:hypothetical protein
MPERRSTTGSNNRRILLEAYEFRKILVRIENGRAIMIAISDT